MARQFESQSRGWQNCSQRIGRLEPIEKCSGYRAEKIQTTPDDDECIYYPLVYGQEDKLKIVANPCHEQFKKSQCTTQSQNPLTKSWTKGIKTVGYETGEDGCYEILRSTVTQSSPPLRHHLASRSQDMHAPVSRSILRAISNDFEKNQHRVMTFEPTVGCRQSFHRTKLAENNNYERPKKANNSAERRFVSPHFDDSLYERQDSEELLDYCTCMFCVKGAFYHFTKDSEDEGHIADQPCSCAGPLNQCLPRWGCLGIFALFLPCLWCYLPLKGCKKLNQSRQSSIKKESIQMGK